MEYINSVIHLYTYCVSYIFGHVLHFDSSISETHVIMHHHGTHCDDALHVCLAVSCCVLQTSTREPRWQDFFPPR